MLRKLLSWSDSRVERALQQTGSGFDISNPPLAANDHQPVRQRPADAKLWIEDWSDEDEVRRIKGDYIWEGYHS